MIYPKETYGRPETPWAVVCKGPFDLPGNGHGFIYLTREEYISQLSNPDALWKCPLCYYEAFWSDDNYESWNEENGEQNEPEDSED